MLPSARCLVLLLLLPCLLVACRNSDPMDQPGTIRARGLNDANLRAMVANPAHLERGVEITTSRGAAAAEPISQLRRGQRRELSGSGSQQGGTSADKGGPQNASR